MATFFIILFIQYYSAICRPSDHTVGRPAPGRDLKPGRAAQRQGLYPKTTTPPIKTTTPPERPPHLLRDHHTSSKTTTPPVKTTKPPPRPPHLLQDHHTSWRPPHLLPRPPHLLYGNIEFISDTVLCKMQLFKKCVCGGIKPLARLTSGVIVKLRGYLLAGAMSEGDQRGAAWWGRQLSQWGVSWWQGRVRTNSCEGQLS